MLDWLACHQCECWLWYDGLKKLQARCGILAEKAELLDAGLAGMPPM
jgi:hypothetical protein